MYYKDMKKISFYLVIIIFIFLCAFYSIGVFDKFFLKSVDEKFYKIGDFSYTGKLLDGKFEGEGKFVFNSGVTYNGLSKKGKLDDSFYFLTRDGYKMYGAFKNNNITKAQLTTNEYKVSIEDDNKINYMNNRGWKYTGDFDSIGQHGEGTLTWSDGSKYVGHFTHGLADKYGVYYSKDGSVNYKGELKNGLFHGFGNYMFNDTQYNGEFENGLPEGKGIYISKQGWSYEGNFRQGVFDGEGIITDISENKIFSEWKKGKRVA